MRKQLWPEAMCQSALFFASLLTAAIHPSCRPTSESNMVTWLRFKTIQSINDAMQESQSKPSDSTIGAVSLLAGFELEYGDDLSYDAHIQGLKIMVSMRGGIHAGGFMSAIRQIVLAVSDDLALYAGKESTFLPSITYPFQSDETPTGLSDGFATLRGARLLLPAGLDLVHQLHIASLSRPVSEEALCKIQQRFYEYDPRKHLAVDYCPVQSSGDDEINYQAERHIRLAALCIARRVRCSNIGLPNRAPLDDQYSTSLLRPELLIDTVYAELCMWALFMICTTVAADNFYLRKILQSSLHKQGLRTWPDTARVLSRYLYPQESHQSCYELWTALSSDEPQEFHLSQPSRYNVAVFNMS